MIKLKNDKSIITPECFKDNEGMLKYLPNWTIFSAVMTLRSPSLPKMSNSKLSTFEIIVMFFMKVRLNLYEGDIGYRFNVHRSTVPRAFH